MITRSSSAYHLELETEDGPELLRIAQLLAVDATGICKISVILVRQGIDEEDLYAKFHQWAARAIEERDAQLDWIQP